MGREGCLRVAQASRFYLTPNNFGLGKNRVGLSLARVIGFVYDDAVTITSERVHVDYFVWKAAVQLDHFAPVANRSSVANFVVALQFCACVRSKAECILRCHIFVVYVLFHIVRLGVHQAKVNDVVGVHVVWVDTLQDLLENQGC